MKKLIVLLMVLLAGTVACAQKLVTRNGYIGFFSQTPLENIKAETTQANAAIDIAKQTLAFAVLVKGFLFQKELMQEHFNENYIESDKYPKATFSGTYNGTLDITKSGTYNVVAKGQLNLHGVNRTIEVPATFQVQASKLVGKAAFAVKPQDYGIQIPALVREKIAQQIAVSVNVEFPLSN
jgi:polyisoprenoid-binding protein YceI